MYTVFRRRPTGASCPQTTTSDHHLRPVRPKWCACNLVVFFCISPRLVGLRTLFLMRADSTLE